jgi:hypothetical protein
MSVGSILSLVLANARGYRFDGYRRRLFDLALLGVLMASLSD